MRTSVIDSGAIKRLLTSIRKLAKTISVESECLIGSKNSYVLWLQHLEVLIPLVGKTWVDTDLQREIIAEIQPFANFLEQCGYGGTALYYHDKAKELCDKYWPENLSLKGHHSSAFSKLKRKNNSNNIRPEACEYKPDLNKPEQILEALRQAVIAWHCASVQESSNDKLIGERAKDITETELEFLYQSSIDYLSRHQRIYTEYKSSDVTWESLQTAILHVGRRLCQANNPALAWSFAFHTQQAALRAGLSPEWQLQLLELLYAGSHRVLNTESTEEKITGDWIRYRSLLKEYDEILAKNLNEDSTELPLASAGIYSQNVQELIKNLMTDCTTSLGPAPANLRFCFLALGSMSRGEMLPNSDMECICLVNDQKYTQWEEAKTLETQYLQAWYRYFEFKVASLSDLNNTVLRLDEDHQGKGHPGDPEMRGSPKSFLLKLKQAVTEYRPEYHSWLQATYLYGNDQRVLYHEYQSELAAWLVSGSVDSSSPAQQIAQIQLQHGLDAWGRRDEKTGEHFSLKKNYWEPAIYILQNLALHYSQQPIYSTLQTIDCLVEKKILSTEAAKDTRDGVNSLYRLRWRQGRLSFLQEDILTVAQRWDILLLEPFYHALVSWLASSIWAPDPLVHWIKQLLESKEALKFSGLIHAVTTRAFDRLNSITDLLNYHREYYQQVPREQREDYLNHLSPALRAIKPTGITATASEWFLQIDQLIQRLTLLPDRDGWRLAKAQQQRLWQAQLAGLFANPAMPDNDLAFCSQIVGYPLTDNIMYYAVTPDVRRQLLKNTGDGQRHFLDKPDGQSGRHTVLTIRIDASSFAAKIYPELPGTEYQIVDLAWRVSGEEMLPNWLVNLQDTRGYGSAIQFFPYLPNTSENHLENILKIHSEYLTQLEPTCFSRLFLRVLVINPEDDKGDDYIVVPMTDAEGRLYYRIIRIDNERAFFPVDEKQSSSFFSAAKSTLLVKSILYCLNSMKEPLHPQVIDEFLMLDPYELLTNWLKESAVPHRLWNGLFDDQTIDRHASWRDPVTREPLPSFPAIILPDKIERELFNRLTLMQYHLREYRQEQVEQKKSSIKDLTALDLLKLVQPNLSFYYEPLFTDFPPDFKKPEQAIARFASLMDNKDQPLYERRESLVRQSRYNGFTALTKSLRLPVSFDRQNLRNIRKGQLYSCERALESLKFIQEQQLDLIRENIIEKKESAISTFQNLSIREQVSLIDTWHKQLSDSKEQRYSESQQKFLLRAYQRTPFIKLELSGFCRVLTDALLDPLLNSASGHLIYLNISRCSLLTEKIMSSIAAKCPNLRTIIMSNLSFTKISPISPWLGNPVPLTFFHLTKLDVSDCKELRSVKITAPLLTQDQIYKEGCTHLNVVLPVQEYKTVVESECHEALTFFVQEFKFQSCFNADLAWLQLSRLFRSLNQTINSRIDIHDCFIQAQKSGISPAVAQFGSWLMYRYGPQIWRDKSKADEIKKKFPGEANMLCLLESVENFFIKKDKNLKISALDFSMIRESGSMVECGKDGAQAIAMLLYLKIPIIHLDFGYHRIGDGGADILASALETKPPLRGLILRCNEIGPYGTIALANSLDESLLLTLCLEGNQIGIEGAKALANALNKSSLFALDLAGNHIGDASALMLAECLKTNPRLRALHLSSTKLGVVGVRALQRALTVNRRKIELDLSSNYGPEEGSTRNTPAELKEASSIKRDIHTGLSDNAFHPEQYLHLLPSLPIRLFQSGGSSAGTSGSESLGTRQLESNF